MEIDDKRFSINTIVLEEYEQETEPLVVLIDRTLIMNPIKARVTAAMEIG